MNHPSGVGPILGPYRGPHLGPLGGHLNGSFPGTPNPNKDFAHGPSHWVGVLTRYLLARARRYYTVPRYLGTRDRARDPFTRTGQGPWDPSVRYAA